MSLRLERSTDTRGFGTLVAATLAVALAVVMFTMFPAAAEAQTENASSPSVVVRPGDSLWSISAERLGPDATPQRILEGAQRIYALNRSRIGPDPDLVFVGQELRLPPALTERSAETRPNEKPAAHKAAEADTEAAGAGPRNRAAKRTPGEIPRAAPSRLHAESGEASETATERGTQVKVLPDEPAAAPVPAVGVVASKDAQPSPIAPFLRTVRAEIASAAREGSWMLGLGVLTLTLVVTALIAWKLPMRRITREDAQRWGTAERYYGYTPAAHRIYPVADHPGSLGGSNGDRAGRDMRPGAPGALGGVRRGSLTGSAGRKGGTAYGRRPAPKAKAVARNSLALGAHNPEVRRAPRRAHAAIRARKLRPRRGAPRRSLPPSIFGRTGGR